MQSLVEKYNKRKEDDVLRSEVYEEMTEYLNKLKILKRIDNNKLKNIYKSYTHCHVAPKNHHRDYQNIGKIF